MKFKVQQKREPAEEKTAEFLGGKNEVITIIISENNMNFIALYNLPDANFRTENKAEIADGGSPATGRVTLSVDFDGGSGGSCKMVFTGGQDKILISDFYNLLTENVRISQKTNYKNEQSAV
ncbi:MAG: hypothetical protein LH472_00915 [Pyrinomonadaceae bacterium]|nr:hypothetical protein [Pyrinomonadaceae bacterium]